MENSDKLQSFQIVTAHQEVKVSSWGEPDEWGLEAYGVTAYNSHPLAELKPVKDENNFDLYLGTFHIKDYDINTFVGNIPALYCVRTFENGYNRFVCGLDLTSDGKVWVGIGEDSRFNTIKEAMDFVERKEDKLCEIWTEDEMQL
jgi:hypothetical protein